MRHLVGDTGIDVDPVAFGGQTIIDEQARIEQEDRAPVLHGRKVEAGAWCRDEVQLRQRIPDAEVVVVVGQQLRGGIEREPGFVAVAVSEHHADLDALDGAGDALQVARRKEQQVGRTSGAVGTKVTCFSPCGRLREAATGMLDTVRSASRTVAVNVKVALRSGSSQQGMNRRASEFSN